MTTHDDASRDGRGPGETIPPVEWAVAALGAVLLVAMLWVLVARGGGDRPPDVVLRAADVHRVTAGWLVDVEVENRGDRTASALLLEGRVLRGGAPVARAEAELDHLPGHSVRRVGLYLDVDPASGTLEVRPVGFAAP